MDGQPFDGGRTGAGRAPTVQFRSPGSGPLPARNYVSRAEGVVFRRRKPGEGVPPRLRRPTPTMPLDPALSAAGGTTRRQRAAALLLLAAGAAAVPTGLLPLAILIGLAPLFWIMIVLNFGALIEAQPPDGAMPERLPDAELPPYTVLVPLYDEVAVLPRLIRAMSALDYPAARLQIMLLIETDDHATRGALAALTLPPTIEVVVLPDGLPRTKPRALNAALPAATGAFLTVYDAEDRPDPGQLRAAGPRVACLQARLAIDNVGASWLTRLFAMEYAALFDVLKAGFARMQLPVALGGTSNHFRIEVLRAIGGWDAWNVTEDADLGIRLARTGHLVGDLASTTEEEAPASLLPWFRQRRRWLKGWMQTLVTHSRDPVAAWRDLGPLAFATVVAMTLGILASALGFPVFAALTVLWLLRGGDADAGWPDLLADSIAGVVFFAGLLLIVAPVVLGLAHRRRLDLLPWMITLPAYFCLICLAAWSALHELHRRPFFWAKTPHGVGPVTGRKPVRRSARAGPAGSHPAGTGWLAAGQDL